MVIDTWEKLKLANEANELEYRQAKEDRKNKAIASMSIMLSHKSTAYRELFSAKMHDILNFYPIRWYQLEDDGTLYDETVPDLNCNTIVAILLGRANLLGRSDSTEERKVMVLEHVPNLTNDEWVAVRDQLANNSRALCTAAWLAELDSLREFGRV